MAILKFQLFYNGQEKYDNTLITFNTETKVWSMIKTTYNTGVFGNFWPHQKNRNNKANQISLNLKVNIYDKEYIFTTSEVAFQASKCEYQKDIIKFTDNNLHSLDSFRMGRKVKLRSDWENVKYQIMLNISFNDYMFAALESPKLIKNKI